MNDKMKILAINTIYKMNHKDILELKDVIFEIKNSVGELA